MRLVACSNCHTQFDVTDVVAESFPCRCGASVENRSLEAVDAKIHRCGSCGAIVDAEDEGCDYCGSTIERDPGKLSLICPECYARCSEDACFCTACGVAFRPEEVRVEGHELPCPVCDALMPPHQIGGVGLNECRSCNGLWVAGDNGVCRHWDGAEWTQTSFTGLDINMLIGWASDGILAIGDGGVFRYDGTNWTQVEDANDAKYVDVHLCKDGSTIATDQRGWVYRGTAD